MTWVGVHAAWGVPGRPATRHSAPRPSGEPGQWRLIAAAPARRTTDRSTMAIVRVPDHRHEVRDHVKRDREVHEQRPQSDPDAARQRPVGRETPQQPDRVWEKAQRFGEQRTARPREYERDDECPPGDCERRRDSDRDPEPGAHRSALVLRRSSARHAYSSCSPLSGTPSPVPSSALARLQTSLAKRSSLDPIAMMNRWP